MKGGVNSGNYYYEYNNKKAIIKANNPIASVSAKHFTNKVKWGGC